MGKECVPNKGQRLRFSEACDTAVVKSEAVRVRVRGEAGREFFMTAFQLKGTGTFALAAAPRGESAWTSKSDIDGAQAAANYVAAEFPALPGVAYRCWALVGGCCAETFAFYLQATEATDLNPKTKQKESIEPGTIEKISLPLLTVPVPQEPSGLWIFSRNLTPRCRYC